MRPAILISTDLMFISKVKEVGRTLHGEVVVARSLSALHNARDTANGVGVLMIDLEKTGVSHDSLRESVEEMVEKGWQVVSFFSHVHEELGAEAEALGFGEVVPRSKFVRLLPGLLEKLSE